MSLRQLPDDDLRYVVFTAAFARNHGRWAEARLELFRRLEARYDTDRAERLVGDQAPAIRLAQMEGPCGKCGLEYDCDICAEITGAGVVISHIKPVEPEPEPMPF